MIEKIMALLAQIDDEAVLEHIFWEIERKLVRQPEGRRSGGR